MFEIKAVKKRIEINEKDIGDIGRKLGDTGLPRNGSIVPATMWRRAPAR